MLSVCYSATLFGIEAQIVNVEVNITNGIPAFDISGLASSTIKEARDRVKTAITNSDIAFPIKKINVNLRPADIKKEGSSFDLPIAVGILACSKIINTDLLSDAFIAGELSLDGTVVPVNGILSMIDSAKKNGFKKCIISKDNFEEASLIKNIDIVPVSSLIDVIKYFKNGDLPLKITKKSEPQTLDFIDKLDFADVSGQDDVKRSILIAAAGNHNILMIGPPGSGKTMMAKRIPTILPSLTYDESVSVTKIYSISNLSKTKNTLIKNRPFRNPHHTLSITALTGGTSNPKPGEISLAHNGILFLDELPEFSRKSLEVLREPMEDKVINISRASGFVTYPANFMLVASMNPCPCGYFGSQTKCTCSESNIQKYIGKISGPLLDRIDIQIEAKAVSYKNITSTEKNTSSSELKNIVLRTIEIQKNRYKNENFNYNSDLSAREIPIYCSLEPNVEKFLQKALEKLNLSFRAYHKILKVSRTIADIEMSEDIQMQHIAEAIQYRNLDRKYWS